MCAVERISHFTTGIPQERPRTIADKDPGPEWPTSGKIAFEDVQLTYRPGLEPALARMSSEVDGGQKVGVGRRA